MAIKIETDRVVKIAYRITDTDGRLIEERTPENPYEYLHGHGQIIAPIARAIVGKTPGHRAEITVTPRDGYGEYDEKLVAELPRTRFPENADLEIGMKFNTLGPEGKPVVIRVIDIDDKVITVDGNHPLAGLEIIFELRVLDVREATQEELDSGRATSAAPATDDRGGVLH